MKPTSEIDWGKTIALILAIAGGLATLWKATQPAKALAKVARRFITYIATEGLTDEEQLSKFIKKVIPELQTVSKLISRIAEVEFEMENYRDTFKAEMKANRLKMQQLVDAQADINRTLQTLVALEVGEKGLREKLLDQLNDER